MDFILRSLQRLRDYEPWEVALELAILWLLVYVIYRFVRGTRAAGAFKGALVVLVVGTVGVRVIDQAGVLPRIGAISDRLLGLAAIVLVVTFQPELRRAFIRLGEAPFFRGAADDAKGVAQAIADSAGFLAKNKFGAIVAIERSVGLRDFAEAGRMIDGELSAQLLNSIFWPSSPLHDMAVIVRGTRIVAAGAQLPLAQPSEMPLTHLGTRHRAAVGLSKRTDAVIVVVSEETGTISVAEDGILKRGLDPEQLMSLLTDRLAGVETVVAASDPATEELEREMHEQLLDDRGQPSATETDSTGAKSKVDPSASRNGVTPPLQDERYSAAKPSARRDATGSAADV